MHFLLTVVSQEELYFMDFVLLMCIKLKELMFPVRILKQHRKERPFDLCVLQYIIQNCCFSSVENVDYMLFVVGERRSPFLHSKTGSRRRCKANSRQEKLMIFCRIFGLEYIKIIDFLLKN